MSPLAFLAPYKTIAEMLAALALVAGICYGVHRFLDSVREEGRQEIRAQWTAQKLADEQAARKAEAENAKRIQEANENVTKRDQTIRALVAAGTISSTGLRDTLNIIRDRVPGSTADALGKSVTALTSVLGDCQDRYRSMAEAADRHASDSLMYQQAWPK